MRPTVPLNRARSLKLLVCGKTGGGAGTMWADEQVSAHWWCRIDVSRVTVVMESSHTEQELLNRYGLDDFASRVSRGALRGVQELRKLRPAQ